MIHGLMTRFIPRMNVQKQKNSTKNVRFQSPAFARSLKSNKINAEASQKEKQGKGPWTYVRTVFNILFALFGVAIFLMVIYWPKLFFIKNIEVTGTEPLRSEIIREKTFEIINNSNKFWPQKNIILFNPNVISNKIKQAFPDILSINSIDKEFPGKITIDITDNFVAYEVIMPGHRYLVYNDGVVAKNDTKHGQIIKINITADREFTVGEKIFLHSFFNQIKNLSQYFYESTGEKIDSFEIAPDATGGFEKEIKSTDIFIKTLPNSRFGFKNDGFFIFTDSNKDPNSTLKMVKVLLENGVKERYSEINYVDVRLESKAFICLKNSACEKKN
jgi:hypothetical protein